MEQQQQQVKMEVKMETAEGQGEQNGRNKLCNGGSGGEQPRPTICSECIPEQGGKVFIGPGGAKEAEVVGFGLSKLSSSQLDELEKAKKYALDQSVRYVMEKQRQAHAQQQQKVALYSQALALMSRIYVGSINFDVFEDQIRSAFGVYGPIKNINLSLDPTTGHHKGFCFIEYEVPEAAFLAKDCMNGRFLGGRTIKVMPVGRQDSTPQALPIIDMIMGEARNHNRVYVANIHPDITEQDLRTVFMAFGEIAKCQLAKHSFGKKHRGFGYIEFKTEVSVKEAVEGMNAFDLGGQFIQVGRCVTPPDAVNYLSVGTSSGAAGALPAAAAIAAAELTAKIAAQEILGGGKKSSPCQSPAGGSGGAASPTVEIGTSSPGQTPEKDSQSSTATVGGTRRRGFGGFAGTTVPPPQQLALPPIGVLAAGERATSSPSATAAQSSTVSAGSSPQLVLPTLGGAASPAPQFTIMAAADDQQEKTSSPSSIDAFYSTLANDKFEPPKTKMMQPAKPTAPLALPSAIPMPQNAAKKKEKKVKTEMSFLDRIGEKAMAKAEGFDASKPASFAPLPKHLAPRDPNATGSDDEEGGLLSIGGPDSWYALALREDNTAVVKTKEEKGGNKKGKGKKEQQKGTVAKRKKGKKPKITSGPKLNTATKIAAASMAGALSDQLQVQKDEKGEEATLASQEHVQIRGNDARHLLIQKLMRTNRSSVVVLRDMVTPEGIDDMLEEEIREECAKYGSVVDVVIVQEHDTESVKIFVRFAEPVQAEGARKAIDGRYFDGRTVKAESYDQVLFDHDDFTG